MEIGYTEEYKNIVQACRERISQSLADVQTSREYEDQQKDIYVQHIKSSKTMTDESVDLLLNGIGTHSVHRKGQSTEEQSLSGLLGSRT